MIADLATADLRPPLTDFDGWVRALFEVADDEDWYDGRIDSVGLPLFEKSSARLALAQIGAETIRAFDRNENRIPVTQSAVAVAYRQTKTAPTIGARFVVRRREIPVLLWLEVDREQVWLFANSGDDDARTDTMDEVIALVRTTCSAWRRQTVRFDPMESDSYTHLDPPQSAQIHLNEDVADQLRLNVVTPLLRFEQVSVWIPRRGVLLQGRPGSGKTWAARWVQAEVAGAVSVVVATPAMFGSPSLLMMLFEFVQADTPCLLVLDDLDLTIRSRFDGGADALGELLSRLDGPATVQGVFTIATTNHADALDAALSERPGRFDVTIEIGDAVPSARAALLTDLVMQFGQDPDAVVDDLVKRTEGWTLAELQNLACLAVLRGLDQEAAPDLGHELALMQFGVGPNDAEAGYL